MSIKGDPVGNCNSCEHAVDLEPDYKVHIIGREFYDGQQRSEKECDNPLVKLRESCALHSRSAPHDL